METKTSPNSTRSSSDSPKCALVINTPGKFTDAIKPQRIHSSPSKRPESPTPPSPIASPKGFRVGDRLSRVESGKKESVTIVNDESLKGSRSSMDISKIDPNSQHNTAFEKKKTHPRKGFSR